MNARHIMLSMAALLPLVALADGADSSAPTATVVVNCAYAHWPTRDEVAHNLRQPVVTVGEPIGPASDARDGRARSEDVAHLQRFIRREGRRYCDEGATHVQVDFLAPRNRSMAVVAPARIAPATM